MSENMITVRVRGDYACFTRPEMKVERVSYPVMTPSAARGILEAIFWEPQMYYLIDTISVVKKGRWVSFRRNEVVKVVSLDNARTWMNSPEKFDRIEAGGGAKDGTQRNMLALEEVEYLITAEVRVTDLGRNSGQRLEKYRIEIERRARQGKCYHRPGLGMREFAADFEWVDDYGSVVLTDWPEEDLGLMLYDVFDHRLRAAGFRWLTDEDPERVKATKEPLPRFEGISIKPQAVFFEARIQKARMVCHPERVKLLVRAADGGG